jgi:hypothetical protein
MQAPGLIIVTVLTFTVQISGVELAMVTGRLLGEAEALKV